MSERFNNTEIAFRIKSDNQLKKAYYLFRLMTYKILTRIGCFVINKIINISWVRQTVKNTVFDHFCAGENQSESLELVKDLNRFNVKSILDYSVEGKATNADFERTCNETLSNIALASKTNGIPFVVFKPTGLGHLSLYEKVQKGVKLSKSEEADWQKIKDRFQKVCERAFSSNVRVMVDAEHSWGQTAIDYLLEEMMEKFNQKKCIVINTLQMYRHDRLNYLKTAERRAQEKGYFLGFKVVRGAYMEKERERAKKMGYPSPINPTKEATDKLYNQALMFILKRIQNILLFAGTHNEKSTALLLSTIEEKGLSINHEHIWLGQLYGMSDHISFNAASLGANVAKYLPYGPVQEVMPYLIRRAEENSSVVGQAAQEMALIKLELKRRKRIK